MWIVTEYIPQCQMDEGDGKHQEFFSSKERAEQYIKEYNIKDYDIDKYDLDCSLLKNPSDIENAYMIWEKEENEKGTWDVHFRIALDEDTAKQYCDKMNKKNPNKQYWYASCSIVDKFKLNILNGNGDIIWE